MCVCFMYVYICTCVCTCLHAYLDCSTEFSLTMHKYIHTIPRCVYIYIIYIHIPVNKYIYIHTHIYMYMPVYIHTSTHIPSRGNRIALENATFPRTRDPVSITCTYYYERLRYCNGSICSSENQKGFGLRACVYVWICVCTYRWTCE